MTREQGTGDRETLLFVTYVGFFPFTYLVNNQLDTAVPGIMKYRY
ncbi:MAG: hypothetical protein ACKO8W_14325 [Dolichospermum sp.]